MCLAAGEAKLEQLTSELGSSKAGHAAAMVSGRDSCG